MEESKAIFNSGRNVSLDFAKGIGMILVVYAHIVFFEPMLTIVYSFHMPLFFVISGILFNEKNITTLACLLNIKLKTYCCPF